MQKSQTKPLISIVIPTYNRKGKVARAIDSCLKQNYPTIEVIVVDDASTDGTKEALRNYGSNPKVRYVQLTNNLGETGARIAGIKKSHGEYISFLDSDDILTESSIADRLIALLDSEYQPAMVYGDIILNGQVRRFKELYGYQYQYLLKELSLCSPNTIMAHRKCFANNFPSQGFPSWGDDDLVLTIGAKYPLIHCGKVVAKQYISPDSVSNSSLNNYLGCKMMVAKYGKEIIHNLGLGRYILWQIRITRSYLIHVGFVYPRVNRFIRYAVYIMDKFLKSKFDNIFV